MTTKSKLSKGLLKVNATSLEFKIHTFDATHAERGQMSHLLEVVECFCQISLHCPGGTVGSSRHSTLSRSET